LQPGKEQSSPVKVMCANDSPSTTSKGRPIRAVTDVLRASVRQKWEWL
jgi:hypothetical protein